VPLPPNVDDDRPKRKRGELIAAVITALVLGFFLFAIVRHWLP